MSGQTRVLLIGLGDLGRRLALGISSQLDGIELIVSGRRIEDGMRFAALASACGRARVRFQPLDALDVDAVHAVLVREQPDLVIQSAALLSPWALARRDTPGARAIATAGFAVQLPAQLPIVRGVMTAVRASGFTGQVINCSFPDVTHPILAALGLAPTIGIGNVGMIAATVRATLRSLGRSEDRVRVVAHHSHVTEAMTRDPSRRVTPVRPRVYLGDAGTPAHELLEHGPPLASSSELNALTCVHGLEIIRAMLPAGAPLATSAPGPRGLPGGWPVQIRGGRVELDLPSTLSWEQALELNRSAAAGDGVARIGDDGTVWFTEAAQRATAAVSRELTAPLAPDDCLARFAVLRRAAMDGR